MSHRNIVTENDFKMKSQKLLTEGMRGYQIISNFVIEHFAIKVKINVL